MQTEIAVFAGGCFWCTEAIYENLRGVISVEPGYTGGTVENPTYEQVCAGTTGHAESIKIEFDPSIISYRDLLEVFFATHNPTTPNQQGNDVGPQYRSAIFYTNHAQREAAEKICAELEAEETYGAETHIVTEIKPLGEFYVAEDYHRNYYKRNSDQPYCSAVITPKLKKFKAKYAHLLK